MKTQLRVGLLVVGAFVAGTSVSQALAMTAAESEQYFYVDGIRMLDADTARVHGQFIVNGVVEFNPSNQADPPQVKIPKLEPFEVKWILGPNGEGRAFAESMGYETVEHDDFSYPPPRG